MDTKASPAIDAASFFDHVREAPFGGKLAQLQVDGINAILSAWGSLGDGDSHKLAYILATTYLETADTMQPIREYGLGAGHDYGKVDQTGKAPYGRGFVQLTFHDNYAKADQKLGLGGQLVGNYDLALEPNIAAEILIRGMIEGWFTGKKLGDYINAAGADFVNARRVVNGTDKAQTIALYAKNFDAALQPAAPQRSAAPAPVAAPGEPIWLRILQAIFDFIRSQFKRTSK